MNPRGKVVSFFGAYLPNHPIYELEILPLLVAVKIWSTYIVGKLVVHYLDNDAARSAFVRAHTSTDLGAVLIAEYVEFEYKFLFLHGSRELQAIATRRMNARHGDGRHLRPDFVERTPPFFTWARPIFEQGALSPMSVFPANFPILCLPGDKLFQSKVG